MLLISRLADRRRPHSSLFLCASILGCLAIVVSLCSHTYITTEIDAPLFTVQQNVGLFGVDQYAISSASGGRSPRMRVTHFELREWELEICPDGAEGGYFFFGGKGVSGKAPADAAEYIAGDRDVGSSAVGSQLRREVVSAGAAGSSNLSLSLSTPAATDAPRAAVFAFPVTQITGDSGEAGDNSDASDPDAHAANVPGAMSAGFKSRMLCDCVSLLRKVGFATCLLCLGGMAFILLAVADVWDAIRIDEVLCSVYGGSVGVAAGGVDGGGAPFAPQINYIGMQEADASAPLPTVVALRSFRTLDNGLLRQLWARAARDLKRSTRRLRVAAGCFFLPAIVLWLYTFFRLSVVRRDLARLLQAFAHLPKALEVPLAMSLGPSFWTTAAVLAGNIALVMHHDTIAKELSSLVVQEEMQLED